MILSRSYKLLHPLRHLLLALLVLATGLASPALAAKALIGNVFVTNSETDLLLYLELENCFTDDIITGINNGIPATFTFYVELDRQRRMWPDQKVISHRFTHTLRYDSLKEEYSVSLGETNRTTTTADIEEAKRWMAEVNGFMTVPLRRLQPESPYRLRVKAKLEKKTLPLYFHYLIPFSSLWDFETDWHSLKFIY